MNEIAKNIVVFIGTLFSLLLLIGAGSDLVFRNYFKHRKEYRRWRDYREKNDGMPVRED